jgi:hypothetical protein
MQQGKGKKNPPMSHGYLGSVLYCLIDLLHINCSKRKLSCTSIQPQVAANEEPPVGNLQIILHEQGPVVIKEQEVVNISTPTKTVKRVVRKLTLKKKGQVF